MGLIMDLYGEGYNLVDGAEHGFYLSNFLENVLK